MMSMFTMRETSVTIYSKSSLAQSRYYAPDVDKLPRETPEQYENRTWMNKLHTCRIGQTLQVCIPVEAIKKSLENAAIRLGMRVKGQGRQTFGGRFRSDVQVSGDTPNLDAVLLYRNYVDGDGNPIPILAREDDVTPLRLHVSGQGKKGTGTRVFRIFPRIEGWSAHPKFHVTDPAIDEDVFLQHLQLAGLSIGIGSFRLENGGHFGRFFVREPIQWTTLDLEQLKAA